MPQSKKPAAPSSRRSAPTAKDEKAAAAAKRRPVAQAAPGDAEAAAARDEALRSNIGALRDVLAGGVVLTAQRIQEAMDDAVARGRLTREDAERLVNGLLVMGRQQTQDVLGELEQIVDKGRSDLDVAAKRVRGASDKVRRATKLGAFPIERYDELTAAAVTAQLDDLEPADLRRVHDYEKRNANRKSVLAAIDKALA
jgi:polyhydroxyalkanoate synthesis regulator phasin